MATYTSRINGRAGSLETWDPAQPLLYALRGALGLHGTKFGCGLGQCGACSVLIDGRSARACVTPVSAIAGRAMCASRSKFASVLAWAVYDRITLKHRSDPGAPQILVGGGKNDIIAIIVGTIVYLALGFVFHPAVIGVPAFGP